jgi:hypothetical protein
MELHEGRAHSSNQSLPCTSSRSRHVGENFSSAWNYASNLKLPWMGVFLRECKLRKRSWHSVAIPLRRTIFFDCPIACSTSLGLCHRKPPPPFIAALL